MGIPGGFCSTSLGKNPLAGISSQQGHMNLGDKCCSAGLITVMLINNPLPLRWLGCSSWRKGSQLPANLSEEAEVPAQGPSAP